MFNALRSEELLVGVGRVLRLVADAPGELEEYQRSQALSAYSVTRLLAAEQAAAADLLAWTKAAFGDAVAADPRPEVVEAERLVGAALDGAGVGSAVGELLERLAPDDPLRDAIHRVLAEMVDREVAALAGAPR